MALQMVSLNSGSNGNCYYVGNADDAVLIDVGISGSQLVKRMKAIGLSMQKVKAIFISHEHSDHINGAPSVASRFKLPVYISHKTASRRPRALAPHAIPIQTDTPVTIGSLQVVPFLKKHDAADPYSFVVHANNTTVGVFTDLGEVCKPLKHYYSQCDAAFLEANYDPEMLENGSYPQALKNRIRGGHGHLSNQQALELFINHSSPNLSLLVLAHLSKENNRPELVEALFNAHAAQVRIEIASRYDPSPLFTVQGNENRLQLYFEPTQMQLF